MVKRTGYDDMMIDNDESNYHTIIVAIPTDFNIEKYLSLREHAGLFNNNLIQKSDLLFLSRAVKDSVIFKFFSNQIPCCTITYFIEILHELGVVMDSITSNRHTQNIISINVLNERLNGMVVKAIKNIVDVEETM